VLPRNPCGNDSEENYPVLKRLVVPAVLLLLSYNSSFAREAEVGHLPPLFDLKDEQGQFHSLEDHIGSPIVLYFTHNMCHYCTQVIAFLKRAHTEYHDRGLVIITINVWAEGGEMIRRYREQFGLPFLMLAGKDPKLLRDYEVNYVPIIVFIGRDGRIKQLYHHFILESEFRKSVREIMEEDSQ
jgi:peroxiredoxin